MTANAKVTKPTRTPGSLEGIRLGQTLDDYEREHGEDIPEWTPEDFARARPISEFPELAEALEHARGQRGPQKSPTKEHIGIRLDREVVEHFRATGPGWQSRINDILVEHLKRGGW
ncbi:MAG: BrnA antitoxin family protein [Devosia sp.]